MEVVCSSRILPDSQWTIWCYKKKYCSHIPELLVVLYLKLDGNEREDGQD
jgi:hypothetical protein